MIAHTRGPSTAPVDAPGRSRYREPMATAGSLLLGMRARATAYALPGFGMAAMAPGGPRLGGFGQFMMEPAGVMVAALVLVLLGVTVEETGSMRRIRLGIGLRLAAPVLFVVTAVWAGARGAPTAQLSTLGWILILAGGALVAHGARFDLAAYADPRHGQPLRLEKLSLDGLVLDASGAAVRIPLADVTSAEVADSGAGRGVMIGVRRGVRREGDGLPWVFAGLDEDTFVLTEHQAGIDAGALVTRLREAAQAAPGFR